jgi:hypothetical protein
VSCQRSADAAGAEQWTSPSDSFGPHHPPSIRTTRAAAESIARDVRFDGLPSGLLVSVLASVPSRLRDIVARHS